MPAAIRLCRFFGNKGLFINYVLGEGVPREWVPYVCLLHRTVCMSYVAYDCVRVTEKRSSDGCKVICGRHKKKGKKAREKKKERVIMLLRHEMNKTKNDFNTYHRDDGALNSLLCLSSLCDTRRTVYI